MGEIYVQKSTAIMMKKSSHHEKGIVWFKFGNMIINVNISKGNLRILFMSILDKIFVIYYTARGSK